MSAGTRLYLISVVDDDKLVVRSYQNNDFSIGEAKPHWDLGRHQTNVTLNASNLPSAPQRYLVIDGISITLTEIGHLRAAWSAQNLTFGTLEAWPVIRPYTTLELTSPENWTTVTVQDYLAWLFDHAMPLAKLQKASYLVIRIGDEEYVYSVNYALTARLVDGNTGDELSRSINIARALEAQGITANAPARDHLRPESTELNPSFRAPNSTPGAAGIGYIVNLSKLNQPSATTALTRDETAIAQTVLIVPIVAALTRQTIEDMWVEYAEQLRSLGSGPVANMLTLLWDGRFSLLTAVLAGFGRASAEVGAVMIVGGNIDHVTRVMTTAIALETSKGDLALALGLGIVLMVLSVGVNAAAHGLRDWALRREYA